MNADLAFPILTFISLSAPPSVVIQLPKVVKGVYCIQLFPFYTNMTGNLSVLRYINFVSLVFRPTILALSSNFLTTIKEESDITIEEELDTTIKEELDTTIEEESDTTSEEESDTTIEEESDTTIEEESDQQN